MSFLSVTRVLRDLSVDRYMSAIRDGSHTRADCGTAERAQPCIFFLCQGNIFLSAAVARLRFESGRRRTAA
jgi:hypothetical protein